MLEEKKIKKKIKKLSRNRRGVGITPDVKDRVWILFTEFINSEFKCGEILHVLRVFTSSSKINSDMDAYLISRLVEDHNEDSACDWFKNSDVWIKSFIPQSKCSTVSPGHPQGE